MDTLPPDRTLLSLLLHGGPLPLLSIALAVTFAVRIVRRRLRQGYYTPSIGDGILFGGVIAFTAFTLGDALAEAIGALSLKGIDADQARRFSVENAAVYAMVGEGLVIAMLLVAFVASVTSPKRKPDISSSSTSLKSHP